jgi:hypothetical protein
MGCTNNAVGDFSPPVWSTNRPLINAIVDQPQVQNLLQPANLPKTRLPGLDPCRSGTRWESTKGRASASVHAPPATAVGTTNQAWSHHAAAGAISENLIWSRDGSSRFRTNVGRCIELQVTSSWETLRCRCANPLTACSILHGLALLSIVIGFVNGHDYHGHVIYHRYLLSLLDAVRDQQQKPISIIVC